MSLKSEYTAFFKAEYIEFSVGVGCPVKCLKYCPQEVTIRNYKSMEKILSLENFKKIMLKLPRSLGIVFSGFCEPFISKEFVKMVQFTHERGHKILVATTLFNATKEDVKKLIKIPLVTLALHLPDGKVTKFPITQEYKDNVFTVIQNVPTLTFALMNDLFVTNNRENITRGFLPKHKRIGYCPKLIIPQFVVLPNGDVYLCCMDFGLWHKLGNLLEENYETIRNRLRTKKPFELCRYCNQNKTYIKHLANQLISIFKQPFLKRKFECKKETKK